MELLDTKFLLNGNQVFYIRQVLEHQHRIKEMNIIVALSCLTIRIYLEERASKTMGQSNISEIINFCSIHMLSRNSLSLTCRQATKTFVK